jgi:hypothetical protein
MQTLADLPVNDLGDLGDPFRCPVCGGANLHIHDWQPVQNLGKQGGIAISFWCEGCQAERDVEQRIELCIEEHKGSVYLYWRDL